MRCRPKKTPTMAEAARRLAMTMLHWGQRLEQPFTQDRDQDEGRHLKAAEEHEQAGDEPWDSVGSGQEGSRRAADQNERRPVDKAVLEHQRGGDPQRADVAEPLEEHRAQ
jgi:hypothetical protein